MKEFLKGMVFILLIVSFIVISFTINQVYQEEKQLTTDLQYRSTLIAENLKDKIELVPVEEEQKNNLQQIIDLNSNKERLVGISIYNNKEKIIASSPDLPAELSESNNITSRSMDEDKATGDFIKLNDKKLYLFALPLHNKNSVIGSLLVVQNANYIDAHIMEIWKNNMFRLLIQVIAISIAILIVIRWIIFEPIKNLVEAIKQARTGEWNEMIPKIQGNLFFRPLINEVIHISRSLFEARRSASEEARLRLEKIDSPWTAQRLQEFAKSILKGRNIYVVSNREPYIHIKNGGKISYYEPASGMVTAIEPMIEACGGIWIAHGSGNADQLVVDKNNKIKVPPDEPKYTLKRIWLSEKEVAGYYYGFSNEGMWPLCHMVHTRPVFRKEDWQEYKNVNGKFAHALLKEITNIPQPIILIQDFHSALLPRMVKKSRPDALIAIFWHIPWPSAEAFSICPWRKEILDGMLGADLIGFHTQLHCNNFIDTVGNELESLINRENFMITRLNHQSFIKSLPISIPYNTEEDALKKISVDEKQKMLNKLGISSSLIGLGVDRLDYTKGIVERLKAVELFLTKYPAYKEKFTFIQIAAPTRSNIPQYQKIAQEVEQETESINKKFATKRWKPIILLEKHHSHDEIENYYQIANTCLVTSLHDGMNLVAKEFVWSRHDEQGVLILSQFTGASRELKDAIIVNPYNIEELAEAIHKAITMMSTEQKKRMVKLREKIKSNNVYRWSADLLKTIVGLE